MGVGSGLLPPQRTRVSGKRRELPVGPEAKPWPQTNLAYLSITEQFYRKENVAGDQRGARKFN